MKAQVKTLEAIVAVSILVATLVFFSLSAKPMQRLSLLNYKLSAYDALSLLEATGELRKDVVNNDVTSLEKRLKPFINAELAVVIFNKTANLQPIPNLLTKESVVACYYIAGDTGTYEPRKLCVYIWGIE